MKDGIGSRRNLETALWTGINATLAQLVERDTNRTALGAIHRRVAKAHSHDVGQARIVVREAREELTNRKGGRCG